MRRLAVSQRLGELFKLDAGGPGQGSSGGQERRRTCHRWRSLRSWVLAVAASKSTRRASATCPSTRTLPGTPD
eukprot:2326245-Rhodomonas_salina.1